MATREEVLEALRGVMDPELGRDIVSLGMVEAWDIDPAGRVRVTVQLTTPACPLKNLIQKNVEAAIRTLPGVTAVEVTLGARVKAREKEKGERLPTVKNVIAVGSGKGGVGKSTVAVNLALALSEAGASVGLLDADLYGPSVPILLGIQDSRASTVTIDGREYLAPQEVAGLRVFSMGLLLDPDQAVIWRGPLLHKALTQFLEDVWWGDLDYLVLDLPPGTGDVQISLANLVPISSAVLVTTPQDVAFADVRRALRMFETTKVPVLGVVENMATFTCSTCGTVHHPFGEGRVRRAVEEMGLAWLGDLPLDAHISPQADQGVPFLLGEPEGLPAAAIRRIASAVAARQSVLNFQGNR